MGSPSGNGRLEGHAGSVFNEIVSMEIEAIMAIGEVCNRAVVIVQRETPVIEAAQLMRHHHVGDVVVVEPGAGLPSPVGILTDRDIVIEVVAAQIAPDTLCVGDLIAGGVATVRETEGVFETMRYMRDQGVRRLPVVDAAGGLVGIVTLDDLLELLAEEMGELSRLVSHERAREAATRS
jgi:CBS domain-containing protein